MSALCGRPSKNRRRLTTIEWPTLVRKPETCEGRWRQGVHGRWREDEVTGAPEAGGGRALSGAGWRAAGDTRWDELSQPVSLLSRLRDWLDPAADAKISFGWSREADWLGDGLVAVSGSDYHGLSSTLAGLKLIDTEAWGVRTLDPGASVHRLAEGTLFAAAPATARPRRKPAWV